MDPMVFAGGVAVLFAAIILGAWMISDALDDVAGAIDEDQQVPLVMPTVCPTCQGTRVGNTAAGGRCQQC